MGSGGSTYLLQVLGRLAGTPKHSDWRREHWAWSSSPSAGMGYGASLEKELKGLQQLVWHGGSQPDWAPIGAAGSPSQAALILVVENKFGNWLQQQPRKKI